MCAWEVFNFLCVPTTWEQDIVSHRNFLEDLAKKLKITDQQGWFNVTPEVIIQHGGASILEQYNNSLNALLSTVYPEYPIIIFHFHHVVSNGDNFPSHLTFGCHHITGIL